MNQTSKNKESKVVIAVKGSLGYGELAMLMNQLN